MNKPPFARLLFLLLLLGVGIFPYAGLFGIMRSKPIDTELSFAAGLICAIALFIWSRQGSLSARRLALGSMAVKLVQIPAYAAWFILGVAFFLFAGFALAFIVDAMAILLSGLVGLAAVLRCRAEGKLERKAAVIHGILQFIFCADVFSAVWVYIKSRKEKESSI